MLKRLKDLLHRKTKKVDSGAPATETQDVSRGESAQRDVKRPTVTVGPRVVHRPIDSSDLDPDAVKIVQRLTRFDHSAYLVGGCVRDLLLDKRPKDFDIGTSATPRQIKRLFRNSRIIGRRFRLAHIYFQRGKIIEVATFRTRNGHDGEDGSAAGKDLLIREDNQFGTPEEDALRRDFTINALFYDINRKTVLDHADGLGDLRRGLVRTIGDPEVRFKEDPIRILRAIKFAARLDFEIEPKTLEALERTRHDIPKAASARVMEEINRYCRGGAARRSFRLLREHGIFDIILPEFARGYREREDDWDLLEALLEQIDKRQQRGVETSTGVILAVLVIPLLRHELGWRASGEAAQPRGLDVRAAVDRYLRPAAVRLRMARRDQELCRQIILTLFRMVPPRRARRNTKRSILRRECFPDALWLLGVLGAELGGEFPGAHQHWKRAAETTDTPDRQGQRRAPRTAATGKGQRPAQSKKRRSTRKRSSSDRPDAAGRDRESSKKKKDESMPPPWDDDYFFAALPSVPSGTPDEGGGDRYGAASVAGGTNGDTEEEAPGPEVGRAEAARPAADGDKPARRRPRRRRRPRKRKRPASSARAESAPSRDRSGSGS
jgi:poly(A) polymerase